MGYFRLDSIRSIIGEGMQVIWVFLVEKSLQLRLVVCAYMQDGGLTGVSATIHRLGACYVYEQT